MPTGAAEALPYRQRTGIRQLQLFRHRIFSTDRASDCIVSLASQAKGVALSFYYGATLPDPDKLLQGSGNQNRFIRLESAATLAKPQVEGLLRVAAVQAKTPLPTSGRGRLIIKSISAKQRPRR